MARYFVYVAVVCCIVGRAHAADAPAPIKITPDDPASLRVGIEAAAKAGLRKVIVPPGVYRLPENKERAYLPFSDLADLEIDARGVTLLRTTPHKTAIVFQRCRNVTFRGATLLNETPPFSQGTIEGLEPAGQWIDLRCDVGYVIKKTDFRSTANPLTGYVFDPQTRQWKAGTLDIGFKEVEQRGDRLFRLHPRHAFRQPIVVGDRMAFRGRGAADIYVIDCEKMNLTELTVLHACGFVVHEHGGEGGSRYSFKITYGPKPAGATEAPLIATNADAFHSSGVRKGPTLENCSFEGMPDDGVAIHGNYAMVMEAADNKLVVALLGENFFRQGDPLRLFDGSGGLLGEAVVTQSGGLIDTYTMPTTPKHDRYKDAKRFAPLTLDKTLPAGFGHFVSTPAFVGSGYVVRNCTIRNHRARGMLLKADNGLVEGNTVDGSTIAGITLAPEYWWNEACYSRNVIIRNNTIRHTGYANAGPGHTQAGALTITSPGDKPAWPAGHRHLLIENNTFVDCDGVNLLIVSAADVQVRGNRFVNSHRQPVDRGTARGVDHGALVQLSHCEQLRLEDNTVINPGPLLKTLIKTGPQVQAEGLETGLKMAK